MEPTKLMNNLSPNLDPAPGQSGSKTLKHKRPLSREQTLKFAQQAREAANMEANQRPSFLAALRASERRRQREAARADNPRRHPKWRKALVTEAMQRYFNREEW